MTFDHQRRPAAWPGFPGLLVLTGDRWRWSGVDLSEIVIVTLVTLFGRHYAESDLEAS